MPAKLGRNAKAALEGGPSTKRGQGQYRGRDPEGPRPVNNSPLLVCVLGEGLLEAPLEGVAEGQLKPLRLAQAKRIGQAAQVARIFGARIGHSAQDLPAIEAALLGQLAYRKRRDLQAPRLNELGEDLTEHRLPHFWVLHFSSSSRESSSRLECSPGGALARFPGGCMGYRGGAIGQLR